MTLSVADLADMRTVQESLLPGTAVVKRATSAQNAIGEPALTWATQATADCRLRPPGLRPDMRIVGEQVQSVANWVVTMAHDTDVQTGDRLEIASETYEVVAVWGDESWATAMRVECKRLEA